MKVEVGDAASFAKTVGESDVSLFAGLTGDFYEAHTNAAKMAGTSFGQRIAHGALLVGFMSAAGTALIGVVRARGDDTVPVALGYDRVRFVAPVFFGDTVTVTYRVAEVDRERRRSVAELTATNQHGATVAVALHLMKWLEPEGPGKDR